MKILVTTGLDLKKSNPQRHHHLLKFLSKKHEITVLNVNAWWLEEKNDKFLQECLKDIDIYYLSESKINPIFQELNTNRCLKSHNLDLKSYDLHINFNTLISGYMLMKNLKMPTIFDICDDLVEWIDISPQIPTILKPLGKFTASFMLNKNIQKSKTITYSTDYLKELYNLNPDISFPIPNGVDTNLFYPKESSVRRNLNISKDDFLLVFVGFLGKWVNFDLILRAINELKKHVNIKLIIGGHGDQLNYIKNFVNHLDIMDNVIFPGNIPYIEVADYISAADVCLVPFDLKRVSQAALPLKLFEYMACERVVISSPLESTQKAVGNRVIYVDNIKDLKNNILNLHHEKAFKLELGKKGKKFVEKNYSWAVIGKKFEDILQLTLEEN